MRGIFLLAVFLPLASYSEAPEYLPPDTQADGMVVQSIKHPMASKNSVGITPFNYYGDRLLKTYGVALDYTKHLSETSAWNFEFSYFQSSRFQMYSIDQYDGSYRFSSYDPAFSLGPGYAWTPVYGKFVAGQGVYRFRAGLSAAVKYMRLNPIDQANVSIDTFGFEPGVLLQMHWTESFLISLRSSLSFYSKAEELGDEKGWRTTWLYGLRLGYVW